MEFRVEHLFLLRRSLSIRMRLFKVSLFVWRCLLHVSILSRINPDYLTESDVGIDTLLRVMFGLIFWLIRTHHFLYHTDKWLKCSCKFDMQLKDPHWWIKWLYTFIYISNTQLNTDYIYKHLKSKHIINLLITIYRL